MHWTLAISVPEGLTWLADQRATPGIAVISYADNLLRARLHFADTDRVAWSFTFEPGKTGSTPPNWRSKLAVRST